ncbi:MAG: SLATT domain-containing protein [Bacteroidetes bacterium]|nr:SLATT domain-containing protein [Bacteroidota bacterium]MBU1114040.1 SLATT domain-containing protein [Bacteroidota bacterium]MBU1799072.1 SLATT domain-containing protein [Bacteroidota bacterium]
MIKEELDFKLWSTKITRFNSAKRLYKWKKFIHISLLIIAIYLVILSVIIFSGNIKTDALEVANFINICLSIVIFSMGLAINLNDIEKRAEKQHECGRKISKLLNQSKSAEADIEKIIEEYDKILDNYENHATIDFYLFCLNQRNRFNSNQKDRIPNFLQLWIITPIMNFIIFYILYFAIIITPGLFIWNILKL